MEILAGMPDLAKYWRKEDSGDSYFSLFNPEAIAHPRSLVYACLSFAPRSCEAKPSNYTRGGLFLYIIYTGMYTSRSGATARRALLTS